MLLIVNLSCKNDKKEDNNQKSETATEVVTEKQEAEKIKIESSTDVIKFNKESFNFSVTGYGANDKSYVVSDIVFKKFEVNSPNNELLGTTLSLDPNSIDTSKNMNNGHGAKWPANFAAVRNDNIINGFFNNLKVKGNVSVAITAVNSGSIDLKVTLNGVSKTVKMEYTTDKTDVLTAIGKLDILDFSASDAFKKFSEICNVAFHQGKTWSEIGLKFSVKTK